MKKNAVILFLAGLLAACVTINIYFPAAAAQEVADQIIDDVWQIEDGDTTKETAPKEETTTKTPESK